MDGYPSVMANFTNNRRIYESVAVTESGNAFAIVKRDGQTDVIENWQVAPDMVNWSSVRSVDLNGT